ncbi:hypothetical protein ACFL2V_03365 [Pseudomonadota bacterium]
MIKKIIRALSIPGQIAEDCRDSIAEADVQAVLDGFRWKTWRRIMDEVKDDREADNRNLPRDIVPYMQWFILRKILIGLEDRGIVEKTKRRDSTPSQGFITSEISLKKEFDDDRQLGGLTYYRLKGQLPLRQR